MTTPFPLLSSEVVLDTFICLKKERLQLPSGQQYDHFVIETTPESVQVVVENSVGQLLVTREWRQAALASVLSFPGGLIEEGEAKESAACREVLEETGVLIHPPTYAGWCYPLPGTLRQRMHVFCAKAKEGSMASPEPTEAIAMSWLSREALFHLIQTGDHVDGTMLASLMLSGL